jgi:NTE family protein
VLGGEIGFTSIGFDYKNYFTINDVHTFAPRVMMGFGDKTLPLSQQYSLGGQNSFFGMRDNEFRGRQIFLSSLEYTVQMPIDIFFDTYFRFRYDLGSIWEEQEQIRFKDLRHGIGASISFDTPIGPADFSVGRSFLFIKDLPDNPVSWGNVLFYFSIGYYY